MHAQASPDAGELTNFQRASVTQDASVKIYGSRVDSVHTIAFQTLSGLSRSSAAAQEGGGGHRCFLGLDGCSHVQCKTATRSECSQHCHSPKMGSMWCEAGLTGGDVMGAEDSAAGQDEGEGAGADATIRRPGKEPKHSTSPAATLEASFEALNVKKFDLTFAMDPLFRRTSAQFDEGGAKGRPCLMCLALLMAPSGFTWAACGAIAVWHDVLMVGWRRP